MLINAVDGPPADAVTVFLQGDVDLDESDLMAAAVLDSARATTTVVILDMSGVTFLGSSGIRALINIRKGLGEKQITVCVDNCSPAVERVLDVTGMRERFPTSSAISKNAG